MSTLLNDIKYAFRQLRKNPGFSITIIAILGLGIGVTTMIFGVAHGVLWRSLNVPYADRLVGLWEEHPEKGQVLGVSPLNFLDWRQQADGFEHDSTLHYLSISTKETSISVPVEPGESYSWWVHKPRAPAASANFTVAEEESPLAVLPFPPLTEE